VNLYYKTLSQIIHRAEIKIPSARRCCPSDTPQFCSPKLTVKVPDEGETLYTSNRENSSHSHIQILQLHSAQNFCFYLRGIFVVHAQLQVLFYPRIMSASWRETFTTSQRVHFPNGQCQNFRQPPLISVILASGACYCIDYRSDLSLNPYICSNIKQQYHIYAEQP